MHDKAARTVTEGRYQSAADSSELIFEAMDVSRDHDYEVEYTQSYESKDNNNPFNSGIKHQTLRTMAHWKFLNFKSP